MTRDDIIRMAREAQSVHATETWTFSLSANQLERFAALVAAAEREACEKVASDYADYQRSFADEYAELRAMGALEVMDRIRARGQE